MVTLTAIQLAPANTSLPQLYNQPYTATGVYSDNSTQDLTSQVSWSVTPSTLATISTAGVLSTSTATGSGSVVATLGSVTGTTPLTVTSAALQSIQLTPVSLELPVGASQTFAVTGLYKDSSGVLSSYDVTSQPGGVWQSSNTTAVSISSQGVASALAAGNASITFTLQSVISSPATITVPSSVTLTGLTIQTGDLSLFAPGAAVNTSAPEIAAAAYSDGTVVAPAAGVTWSIDNTSVATVDAATGLVTAVGVGTANVTASLGGFSDTIIVTVSAVTLNSIAVTTATPSVPLSLPAQFFATGSFSDGSSSDITSQVTWTVQNSAVASVNNAGLVTPLTTGSTSVVATVGSISGSATLTVTPATLVAIQLTPANAAKLPVGFSLQFIAQGTYSDGTKFAVTNQATWTSDNTAAATISNAAGSQGLATGLAAGIANITANIGSITSTATQLVVDTATLTAITISPTTATMVSNSKLQFFASGTFSDGSSGLDITKQVNWNVTKQKHLVTISNVATTKGLAHANFNNNKTGTVTVTATLDGINSNSASISKVSSAAPTTKALGESSASGGAGAGAAAPLVLLGGLGMAWARRRRGRAARQQKAS